MQSSGVTAGSSTNLDHIWGIYFSPQHRYLHLFFSRSTLGKRWLPAGNQDSKKIFLRVRLAGVEAGLDNQAGSSGEQEDGHTHCCCGHAGHRVIPSVVRAHVRTIWGGGGQMLKVDKTTDTDRKNLSALCCCRRNGAFVHCWQLIKKIIGWFQLHRCVNLLLLLLFNYRGKFWWLWPVGLTIKQYEDINFHCVLTFNRLKINIK